MKALIAVAIICALAAGALFWPLGGRSFWQRAGERGLPHAAAQSAARGVRSAWDLLFHHARPTPAAPVNSPAKVRRSARAIPETAPLPETIPVRAAGLAGPDRIVAQPPKERLQANDRAGLEKLLRAR